jgi:hypothetical protein
VRSDRFTGSGTAFELIAAKRAGTPVESAAEGDVWRLRLAGEWSGVDEVLMWEVRHLPSTDHRSMIVDLRFLEFADAVVIRVLLDGQLSPRARV